MEPRELSATTNRVSLLRERLRRTRSRMRVNAFRSVAMPDVSAPPPDGFRTFKSPELERRFASVGYVVIPFVCSDRLAQLRAACTRAHQTSTGGWDCDFYTDDPSLKNEVRSAISGAFAPAIADVFSDHASVLHSFVVNWPGPNGGLELHEHSAIVDQRRFRSVVVWCALEDSDEANGTLHVVERSHLLGRGPKAERGPAWFEPHLDLLLNNYLTSVKVRAGEALIFDNALLHVSFPNVTQNARRTAVATVIPASADFLYHDWVGDGTTIAYRLDEQFFLERRPGAMEWSAPVGLTPIETLPPFDHDVPLARLQSVLKKGTCAHPATGDSQSV